VWRSESTWVADRRGGVENGAKGGVDKKGKGEVDDEDFFDCKEIWGGGYPPMRRVDRWVDEGEVVGCRG
jgi:hypothetical protein